MMQRCIKVDGKPKTDIKYPAGFMDVISIEKTKQTFRLLYDTKGRFLLHQIKEEEGLYKLCRVKNIIYTNKQIPSIVTHDGRTIRFPDPTIKMHATVRVDIATNKIQDHVNFENGNIAMIMGGNNIGRVATIVHRERHPGSFEIVHLKDAKGHQFATRLENV